MIEKIIEIQKALESELYNCALTLTLTLPDICGKVEYPELKSKDRYILWFDNYAKPLFITSAQFLPGEKIVDYTIISAEELWKIRCAVFHSGNYKVQGISLSDISFHAHRRNGENYSHFIRDARKADFDVIFICETVCRAAEQYYCGKNDKSVFSTDEVEICTW